MPARAPAARRAVGMMGLLCLPALHGWPEGPAKRKERRKKKVRQKRKKKERYSACPTKGVLLRSVPTAPRCLICYSKQGVLYGPTGLMYGSQPFGLFAV